MTTEHVVVTGGAGYIGSHVVLRLLEEGYRVTVVDSLVTGHKEALRRVEVLTGKNVQFIQMDVRAKALPFALIPFGDIHAIIHLAGLKSVPESIQNPTKYYQNNLDGTLAVLGIAAVYGVRKLVFSSSAAVYSHGGDGLLHEESATGAGISPYAYSKLVSERMIMDEVASRKALTAVVLRYFNPIGAHPSGAIGEHGSSGNIMPNVLRVADDELATLLIYGDDYPTSDGTPERDYIHVMDLADAHLAALQLDDHDSHLYNVGAGEGTTVLQLLEEFYYATNLHTMWEAVGRRAGDTASAVAVVTKAVDELGWAAQRTLRDSLTDAMNWYTQNPEGYSRG